MAFSFEKGRFHAVFPGKEKSFTFVEENP